LPARQFPARKTGTLPRSGRVPRRCAAGTNTLRLPGPPLRCGSSPCSNPLHIFAKSRARRPARPSRCTCAPNPPESAGSAALAEPKFACASQIPHLGQGGPSQRSGEPRVRRAHPQTGRTSILGTVSRTVNAALVKGALLRHRAQANQYFAFFSAADNPASSLLAKRARLSSQVTPSASASLRKPSEGFIAGYADIRGIISREPPAIHENDAPHAVPRRKPNLSKDAFRADRSAVTATGLNEPIYHDSSRVLLEAVQLRGENKRGNLHLGMRYVVKRHGLNETKRQKS